jgi:hypothetical protein
MAARHAVFATLLYFVLVVVAAGSSWITTGKEPALLAWIGGTLLLLILMIRMVRQTLALTGALKGMLAAGVVTVMVAVLAFLGFVVMVNVWELLDLGH